MEQAQVDSILHEMKALREEMSFLRAGIKMHAAYLKMMIEKEGK